MAAERSCEGLTKAGKPCKAKPLGAGTEIAGVAVSGDYCRAHDPDLPDSARFGSRAQAKEAGDQGGRPANPRVVDVIRERLEGEIDEWWGVLVAARQATQPYTVGWGEHAYVEFTPDHRTRLQALREVLDRSYGRPKQSTELNGEMNIRNSDQLVREVERMTELLAERKLAERLEA